MDIRYEEMLLQMKKSKMVRPDVQLTEERDDNVSNTIDNFLSDEKRKGVKSNMRSSDKFPNADVKQIRDFPKELVMLVKKEFPDARKISDALAAYVVVTSGKIPNTMSEEVKRLVNNYNGNFKFIEIEDRLKDLEKNQKLVNTVLNELKVSTAWLLFDKFGFRRDHPNKISASNIIEEGVEELIEVMEKQSREMKQIKSSKRYRR